MIMIDQRKRSPFSGKDAHKTEKGVLMGFILAVCLIAAVSEIREPKAAIRVDSVVGATYDNLMSEEMAAYTVLYGHNETFTEFDME